MQCSTHQSPALPDSQPLHYPAALAKVARPDYNVPAAGDRPARCVRQRNKGRPSQGPRPFPKAHHIDHSAPVLNRDHQMHSINTNSIVFQAKDQLSCELGGEAAILNLGNGVYYGLDPVAARIWELIQAPRAVSDVRDLLVAEYDVDVGRCERDVLVLLE